MITLNNPRITATTIHPPRGNSEHTNCNRCGIKFVTRHRKPNDRTHCRDCKPYEEEAN